MQQNSIFNAFNCLVLEKHIENIAIQNNHKRVVIISDGIIKDGGKI
jgi:hypothetical protein